MARQVGREYTVSVILEEDTRAMVDGAFEKPTDTYVVLGGRRGFNADSEKETVDTTGADTIGSVRRSKVTFISISGSVDGVYDSDSAANVRATLDYIRNTPDSYGWLKISSLLPDGTLVEEELYCLFTSSGKDMAYDAEVTFSFDYEGQQPWIVTETAPTP